MDIQKLISTVVFIAIVAAIAGPVVFRTSRNLLARYRIRQHMKTIPGPLLGVIYPDLVKKDDGR